MMTYEDLLKNAPDHQSPAFIRYLKENNEVVDESPYWIMIKNFKYHKEDKPWYTIFSIRNRLYEEDWVDLNTILLTYTDWEWLKKSPDKQTVKRFHMHIYKQ